MNDDEIVFRDGFQVEKVRLTLPIDTVNLDRETKRRVTICNLFMHHKLTLGDIVRVLDEDYRHVVKVLLTSGIVRERRENRGEPPKGIDRRKN